MYDNLISENIWLIGAGIIAQEYAKVLQGQNKSFSVIGRSKESAELFSEKLKIPVVTGGVNKAVSSSSTPPKYAIVAVGINQLASVCIELIDFGVRNILVEKPAGMNKWEINQICDRARAQEAKVFVAYNRRFFASTLKAQKIIEEDEGVTSFNFEFTEWSHIIEKLDKPMEVFEAWFLANSTHIVDLAFFLGGAPTKMSCFIFGATDWYKKASAFSGAGITDKNALFSYQANWKGPGRWSVELITSKHRIIFRPIEKLQIQNIGSIEVNFIEIDDKLDNEYKPGFYLQTQAFLEEKHHMLLGIEDHYKRTLFYEHIETGGNMFVK